MACHCDGRACALPEIHTQPANAPACVGSSASLCVGATGAEPLTYQWRFHGERATNAPANVSGATNACLGVTPVATNDAGYYSVLVSNPLGSVVSTPALLTVTPVCTQIDLFAGLTITGGVAGQPYRVQSTADLGDTNWITRSTITQAVSGTFWLDPTPATYQRQFYRVIPAP